MIFILENDEFSGLPEKTIPDVHLYWKEFAEIPKTESARAVPKTVFNAGSDSEKNSKCRLCAGKLAPIRSFLHIGSVPVLVLHYTGEFRKKQKPFYKTDRNAVFRTEESENLMDRLVKKVFGFPMRNFYYQEIPACTFNADSSSDADWAERVRNCMIHAEDTIKIHNIRAVIITGAAAVLMLGKDRAGVETGKISKYRFGNTETDGIVLRSPEGMLSLEARRKSFEKNKNSEEYKRAREEENRVKEDTVKYMTEFRNRFSL
ncbi:MAG TPA: hypothetical protein PK453_18905 [Leptospiraceae bacterium]|nr:hypothetical protein [Leptospiraceae bacterium]HMY66164.1 hypothetical protein [Leptospiraceae bacterium]HNF15742.1 hypothetical protein [Leptospiraceae bacterium]HNF28224.1 hypothetical protein [Leptospiraceae bacterium]HNI97677.1 hypothetical protein [Leptospiraceae bacterium]